MNKTFIIGNLTKDPNPRTAQTSDGPVSVCDFTVAVNRRGKRSSNGQQEADYFKVTAWRGLADTCAQYLAKGKKVYVSGQVSASAYMGNDGNPRASLELTADEIEFLTPKNSSDGQSGANGYQSGYQNSQASQPHPPQGNIDQQSGYPQVEDEELPF